MFDIRPATQADFPAIHLMIRSERINPMDLDWRRFIVSTDQGGEVIGCGQVKNHRDGSQELASIVVLPAWRGQGVARRLIDRLVETHPGELYLTCRSGLEPLYEKFGFRTIGAAEMPPYFRRISRLARAFLALARADEKLLVMKRN